jgi:hypothetical protein
MHEADHALSSIATVKNVWNYIFTPPLPLSLHCVMLIYARGQFCALPLPFVDATEIIHHKDTL